MSEKTITFEHISKSYKDGKKKRQVLCDISGFVEKGSINVILGESGCGKTTFLSVLSGIEKPDEGRVMVKEKDFYHLQSDYQAKLRGKFFGIVFQDFNLVDELTVKDNILLPLKINKIPFDQKLYDDLIYRINLLNVQDSYPCELSGGEKQRTAIARAMIIKPVAIFADEPTGNLDDKNSAEIINIFTEMNRIYNTSIIVVTHDTNLFTNPNTVFKIHDGRLYIF